VRLPAELREALDKTGLPWGIENGTRHNKIRLAGRLVGVYPHGRKHEADKRALFNTISQVRVTARLLKEI
jgi:hypothetical protein